MNKYIYYALLVKTLLSFHGTQIWHKKLWLKYRTVNILRLYKYLQFKRKTCFVWIRVESQVEDFSDVRKFSSFSYSDTRLNPGTSHRKVGSVQFLTVGILFFFLHLKLIALPFSTLYIYSFNLHFILQNFSKSHF